MTPEGKILGQSGSVTKYICKKGGDLSTQGPHSHILMTGRSEGFFGSDILAKRDFFGSMKDAGIFWGRENNTGMFLGIVFFVSSNQQ